MARSIIPNKKTNTEKLLTIVSKSELNKNLGVYTFVDEHGNVTQIKKEKKSIKKYYPNIPSAVEYIIGEVYVIGITNDIAMGIGDDVMAYAQYL